MTDDPRDPAPKTSSAPPRRLTEAEANDPQRKRRSVMIALALVAFAVVVMAVTMTRLAQNRTAAEAQNSDAVQTSVRQQP